MKTIKKGSDVFMENYTLQCRISEYQSVLTLLQLQCDYILSDNSVTVKVNKFLDSILTIVDKFSNSVAQSIDKFDISKININEEDIKKIQEFLSIIK